MTILFPTIHPETLSSVAAPVRKSRTIISYTSNRTASTTRMGKTVSQEQLIQHAYQRVICAYATLFALYRTGMTSDGPDDNLSVWIDPADMQGGRGSDGFHAAHACMTAGIRDNRREQMILEIQAKGVVTPKKKRILEAKGFTEADFDALTQSKKNSKVIHTIFDRIWKDTSLLQGTEFYQLLQVTTALPAEVNLQVDLRLEMSKRAKVAEIIKRCMQGTLNPQEACDEVIVEIRGHLTQALVDLNTKKAIIARMNKLVMRHRYYTALTQKTGKISYRQKMHTINIELRRQHSQLRRTVNGAPYLRLQQLHTFLRAPRPSHSALTKELQRTEEKLSRLHTYTKCELNGTSQPTYALIQGKIRRKAHPPTLLTSPERSPIKLKMLAPRHFYTQTN